MTPEMVDQKFAWITCSHCGSTVFVEKTSRLYKAELERAIRLSADQVEFDFGVITNADYCKECNDLTLHSAGVCEVCKEKAEKLKGGSGR